MDLDRYFEEAVPQIDPFGEDKSMGKWNSAIDADSDSDRNGFDCNICLDSVQDPVVTLCGHLYCWPCIYKWLHFQTISSESEEHRRPQCPVCKSQVSQTSLVPLYGRGSTSNSSRGKASHVGMVIPRRPLGPTCLLDSSRSTNTPQPASQFYHRHHPYRSQQLNSATSNYISPMLGTGGPLTNAFDTTSGIFAEMIYARVFGNQVTNIYAYPDSYRLAGNNNPRVRRHLMQADKSLNRICSFLLCCVILCLLLF